MTTRLNSRDDGWSSQWRLCNLKPRIPKVQKFQRFFGRQRKSGAEVFWETKKTQKDIPGKINTHTSKKKIFSSFFFRLGCCLWQKIKLRHHPGWKGWKEVTTDEAKASCLHCLHDFLTPFTSLPHGIMTSFRTPSDRLHGNGNHLEIPNRSTRKEKKIFRRVNNSLTQKLFWTKACFFFAASGHCTFYPEILPASCFFVLVVILSCAPGYGLYPWCPLHGTWCWTRWVVLCGGSGNVFFASPFWSFFQGSHLALPSARKQIWAPKKHHIFSEIAGVISQETKWIKNDATKCWCNKGGHMTLNKKKAQTVAAPCTCLLSNPACAKFDWLQTLELPKQHSF